jgi:uncharacterized protein (DUF1697 family)
MGCFCAFLRGVNVGGVVLKMEDFRKLLAYIGFSNARTYIQSGNAVFESPESNRRKMEAEIAHEVKHLVGRDIAVFVLSAGDLGNIVAAHPLAAMGDSGKLYVTLLSQDPEAGDRDNLLGTMNDIDLHAMGSRVVYSFYGEGYGKSKRSNNFIEKMLRVSATTRNWDTMNMVYQMARSGGQEPVQPAIG